MCHCMTLLLVLVICLHGYLLCAKGTRLAPYTYVFPMSTPVTLLTPLVTPVDKPVDNSGKPVDNSRPVDNLWITWPVDKSVDNLCITCG